MEAGVELVNGYVLRPDRYYSPSYRIGPFSTADVSQNFQIIQTGNVSHDLNSKFPTKKWCFTSCGKEAIALALAAIGLKREDCVTILTTSGNRYISGCVTREIEKVCRWSRQMESATAAVFVNHEFGYPYREIDELKKLGIPIIEDAAHSFLSNTPSQSMGFLGDFILFSLPKVFPVQMGGILAFDHRYEIQSSVIAGSEQEIALSKWVSQYLPESSRIKAARIANHYQLEDRFSALGCTPRFKLLENDVPGVFLFSTPANVDLQAMKQHGWNHGIECSVFYGENAFYIPVHHRLHIHDLDYFEKVFRNFLSGRC